MKVVTETNQGNVDHYKVGLIYGGRDLGRYTSINKGYISVVIYGATCDDID